jgi:zinc/manganese transport system substrate-binding protein
MMGAGCCRAAYAKGLEMKKNYILAALAAAILTSDPRARAEVRVVTTDTTLAYIAREVGGNKVTVESLSKGTDDPHHVEPTPSMVVKVARAQIVARIGMDLDIWLDPILDKAGNSKVAKDGPGYADCSRNLVVQEPPPPSINPAMGDIHQFGNPHYLLDPANGILAAGNIAAALIRVDPGNQPYYHQRFKAFGEQLKDKLDDWRKQLAPFKGTQLVVYHKTWVYFMSRFGLKEFSAIEPKPGIQPSQGHVNGLIAEMKSRGIKAVMAENFRSHRFPDLISSQTGAKVVYVPVAVDAEPGVDTYVKLFDTIVSRVAGALK